MSGAHFINYVRKKSGAHVFFEERVMSAKLSNERVMSAKLSNEPKKSVFDVLQYLFHWCFHRLKEFLVSAK